MKEQSQNKASSQFLKTDGGKTKSNEIEVPSISLPKGGQIYLPSPPTRDPSPVIFMKYLFSILVIFFITVSVSAQNDTIPQLPPISPGQPPTLVIFIGVGSNKPNSTGKEQAYLLDAKGINISIYKPLLKRKTFSFGLNAGTDYTISNKVQVSTLPNPYHVAKETSSEVTFKSSRTPSKFPPSSSGTSQTGYKFEVGPQFDFYLGKRLVFSPVFQVGYMNMTQKEFSVIQTTRLNGSTYNYNLLSQTETKTSGLSISPKLRIQYFFTRSIGLWAEANYTMGPTIKNTVSTFSPQGNPDVNGQYNFQQMQTGTISKEVRETKYNFVGVNFGLALRIHVIDETRHVGDRHK